MPICAPVGGSAGVGMNGQNAGAWSLVIRQVATGAFAGEDIATQARQSLTNVKAILEAAGYTCADVVKTTVYLAHMEDFAAMNQVYAEFFSAPYPARAAFEVACLPKNALVEIECVAVKA